MESKDFWYKCPYCGQKLFHYDPETVHVEGIKIKCKGRNCGRIIDVKIDKEKQLEPLSL